MNIAIFQRQYSDSGFRRRKYRGMAPFEETYQGNLIYVESIEDLIGISIHKAVFPSNWYLGYSDITALLSQLLLVLSDNEEISNLSYIKLAIKQGHGNYLNPKRGSLHRNSIYDSIVNHPIIYGKPLGATRRRGRPN